MSELLPRRGGARTWGQPTWHSVAPPEPLAEGGAHASQVGGGGQACSRGRRRGGSAEPHSWAPTCTCLQDGRGGCGERDGRQRARHLSWGALARSAAGHPGVAAQWQQLQAVQCAGGRAGLALPDSPPPPHTHAHAGGTPPPPPPHTPTHTHAHAGGPAKNPLRACVRGGARGRRQLRDAWGAPAALRSAACLVAPLSPAQTSTLQPAVRSVKCGGKGVAARTAKGRAYCGRRAVVAVPLGIVRVRTWRHHCQGLCCPARLPLPPVHSRAAMARPNAPAAPRPRPCSAAASRLSRACPPARPRCSSPWARAPSPRRGCCSRSPSGTRTPRGPPAASRCGAKWLSWQRCARRTHARVHSAGCALRSLPTPPRPHRPLQGAQLDHAGAHRRAGAAQGLEERRVH